MNGRGTRYLLGKLRAIAHVDHAACAEALSALPGITLPFRLRVQTLRRVLAYEFQKGASGGTSPKELRAFKAIAGGKSDVDVGAAITSPGTQLVREWNVCRRTCASARASTDAGQ